MITAPAVHSDENGATLRLSGDWSAATAGAAEALLDAVIEKGAVRNIDVSRIGRLDTAGAWLITRAQSLLEARGAGVALTDATPDQLTMLKEARYRVFDESRPVQPGGLAGFLNDVGRSVVSIGQDFAAGIAFLGEVVAAIVKTILHINRLRPAAFFYHLESFGFRSVPIITLICFLVGAIVAQQSMFQLQRFGASFFAVDLIGILTLRELGVLLTSIMIAGRSGSAITAEIGSMKMREEIDAMRVMGFDPIEMLIAPRIMALIVALPLLTFLADMAGILGGFFVAVTYGDMAPEIFFSRLKDSIGMNTFLVGLVKAPFMALVIGVIASMEGLAVQGSAESLGRRVTAAVVKSIFMVILVDGLFAMFFAAIKV